jgi:hypothetical protein
MTGNAEKRHIRIPGRQFIQIGSIAKAGQTQNFAEIKLKV